MSKGTVITIMVFAVLIIASSAFCGGLDEKIRVTQSDLRVLCPAVRSEDIQWGPLLYLNQAYGAEIYILLVQPSPFFGCQTVSTPDEQFHLARVGKGAEMADEAFADSVLTRFFPSHGYPDIVIAQANNATDSSLLFSMINRIHAVSQADSNALAPLEKIYIRTAADTGALIFNDFELFGKYAAKAADIDSLFAPNGPLGYKQERYRRYRLVATDSVPAKPRGDFAAGLDMFRLPNLISKRLIEGPEKTNIQNRLTKYRSFIRAAQARNIGRLEQTRLLASAYSEINHLVETFQSGGGRTVSSGALERAKTIQKRTYIALTEALGIKFHGDLVVRDTPAGKATKLMVDLTVTGPLPVELAYLKVMPVGGMPIAVDSISKKVQPHQRFYREYLVDTTGQTMKLGGKDSMQYAVEAVVEDIPIDLLVPYTKYSGGRVSISFLPGYAVLKPFGEGENTAIAQTFDWQLLITKPYDEELHGRLEIVVPDGIVVGTFDKSIDIPAGIAQKYMDIHLAAGFSIGTDIRVINAALYVSREKVASTTASARVIRCDVPESRRIAYIPDPNGQLEDFLRMLHTSFQPFTAQSLIRAPLEAYGLVVIGTNVPEYGPTLRGVSDRLREYVRQGGTILIFGQPLSWPHDLFPFSIYPAKSPVMLPPKVVDNGNQLLNNPYKVDAGQLVEKTDGDLSLYPAIIDSGDEIISAGEPGSYLKVSHLGDGTVIYCGLPLLEMAARLNTDAIHLLANLLNFGHGK